MRQKSHKSTHGTTSGRPCPRPDVTLVQRSRRIPPFGFALALAAGLPSVPRMPGQDPADLPAARSGAALGLDLYPTLAAKDGNVVFSPYSISEMVALLSAGAEGKTREELLTALHWGQPADGLAPAFEAQDRDLVRPIQGGATLLVANGLWYQQGGEPRPAILRTAKDEYGAEVRSADFIGAASAVRHEINAWVGLKTVGRIPDLLPPGTLNGATRLALLNAVYFKGLWEHPFRADGTAPRPFYLQAGTSVMAPQMTERERLRAASAPDCDLLELPYRGGGALDGDPAPEGTRGPVRPRTEPEAAEPQRMPGGA
jgi:serpin B